MLYSDRIGLIVLCSVDPSNFLARKSPAAGDAMPSLFSAPHRGTIEGEHE
ncbi:hypothetical protein [Tardiphaga sp. 709]|jgi:hypothetical protein|nr:hypothetical protein [Tardiphaga sp. 709]WNV10632.1 hypothetical protein RSO67_05440 [Tardiphaga sp. 709]